MKYSSGQARTTVNIDQKAFSNLEFLAKLHNSGIVGAISNAMHPISVRYEGRVPSDDKHLRQCDKILDYAKRIEKGGEARPQKTIRKSIVIPGEDLRALNRFSKENDVKRDSIIISAVNIDAEACYEAVKYHIKLKKKFLKEVLKPVCDNFEDKIGHYFDLAYNKMEIYSSYNYQVYYDFDVFEAGMSSLSDGYFAFSESVQEFENDIARLEGLL
jgi:hypothetical protein